MIMAGKVPTVKPYTPWYKAPGNTHVSTVDKFDVDRQGNGFVVTVYEYLNKKKETCQEVIRVKHMGKVTIRDLATCYGCGEVHARAMESHDFITAYNRLCLATPPNRTYHFDHTGLAIKCSGLPGDLVDMTELRQIWPPVEAK
ncbi:hypothetical protein D3C81_889430 [compost metagenome]